jgi:hypothetical protein
MRWPNTAHWQRFVSACRHTDRSGWRSAGAALLNCEKRELRALVDRNMHPDQVRQLYALLVDHLHGYAEDLKRQADDAYYAASDVMRAADNGIAFDLDAWMRDSEPPCSGEVAKFFSNAIAELLEDA